jgi:hypothetical protein
MTERYELTQMNEFELTKNSQARTLGSEVRNPMEEISETESSSKNDLASLNNEIISIVERRRALGQDHAEFEASKKVWETFLEKDLNHGKVLRIVGGTAYNPDSPTEMEDKYTPEQKAKLQENLQRIMDDPRKFDAALSVINSLDSNTLMNSLSGEQGKFIIGVLVGGFPHEDYQDQLGKILQENNNNAPAEIKELIAMIKKDTEQTQNPSQQQMADEKISIHPTKIIEARKAWERELKRKKSKGEDVEDEYLSLMEYAVARGKMPEEYTLGGGALGGGDGLFSRMDETAYANVNIQAAVLKLRESGEENAITEQLIKEVRDELRNDLKQGLVTVAEYEKVKEDIRELSNIYKERKEARTNQGYRNFVTLREQQQDWTPLDALIENVLQYQSADDIDLPGDKDDKFSALRQRVSADENVERALAAIYSTNPLRATDLQKNWEEITNTTDFIAYRSKITDFLQDLKANFIAYIEPPENMTEQQKENLTRSLLEQGETTKKGIRFKIGEWMKQDSGVDVKELIGREPQNIKELAYWIMMTDDASIWSPEGPLPLVELVRTGRRRMNPATGAFEDEMRGEFRKDNFVLWLRNKMIEHHNDNSNDPVSFLQQVAIQTLYRPVSILEMKYNKQRYFADPDTGIVDGNLYGEIINEAWLFGVRRNNNLVYIQSMNSDEDLFKQLVGLNAKNEHTTGTNLVDYMSMASNFGNEGDNILGDALLTANLIYRNLSDIENLRRLLPEDSALFSVESFKKAVRVINEKGFDEEVTGHGNLYIDGNRIYTVNPKTKIITEIFNSEGVRADDNLIKFLDIFVTPNSDETNEQVVRELVKQTVAHMLNLDDGTTKEGYEKFKEKMPEATISQYRKLARINLEFAETNSWVEQRWNGQAARNDTGYRGYDAWTKMFAQYYRERQSGPNTNGPIGNPHDIQIFKLLSPDMWLSLRTESGQTAQEIFERIHDLNLKLYSLPEKGLTEEQEANKTVWEKQKKEVYNKLRFPRNTQFDWAANGIKRQAEVWHSVMNTEDLGFDKLVTRNNWGVLKYSRAEFEKVVKDGFIKMRRYAFKSNNAINYGAMTRSRQRVKIDWNPDGTIKSEDFAYKDMTVADAMFGDIVMKSVREGWYRGKGDEQLKFKYADEDGKSVTKNRDNASFQEYLNSDEARDTLLKHVSRAGLAAQLKAHRSRMGTGERWNPEMVRKFYESLRSMPQYIQDPETGREISIPQSQFFSLEDIKWIKEQTGTSDAALLMEDARAVGWDMMAGIPEMFSVFFKGLLAA